MRPEQKKQVRNVFESYDLMSSETSDQGSDGKEVLASRPRPWESEELKAIKDKLDRVEMDHATPQSMRQRSRRGYVAEQSTRPRPDVDPQDEWILCPGSL